MKNRTVRWTVLWIVCAVLFSACSPAATPTPEPPAPVDVADVVIEAREAALSYVLKTYGEQVFPAPGSGWEARRTTPEGLVGSETFEFAAGDVTVTIQYPVVAPQNVIYKVTVAKTGGFSWEGQVDANGAVTETFS